jgi:hypothetical protein
MDFSLSVSQLVITSSATVIATENTEKEINLTTNKSGASFAITGGADKDKFSLSGATLVFEATDFEARADDNTYEVEITASNAGKNNTTQVLVVRLISFSVFSVAITVADEVMTRWLTLRLKSIAVEVFMPSETVMLML